MKKNVGILMIALAIIVSAAIVGNAYKNRTKKAGTISTTGLGEKNFISDLIVWEGRFETNNFNLKEAYINLENDKQTVLTYLKSKGLKDEELVFTAVKTSENRKTKYTPNGQFAGNEFDGYNLSQSVQIQSKEVEKIERISREVTELLNQGIQFYSEPPRYYYTKLADLKIEMISKATEDARIRAEKISEFSGGKLGDLQSAKMGIFQITGQNSGEDYSWGGTYNTDSKEKTASITMKLIYTVDD
ncbi:MAG: SIMPL domain-containing protein [Flavobacteriales bacterium]